LNKLTTLSIPKDCRTVQGWSARHSPSPCQIYCFGLETCAVLLAQTLNFIDLCTGKHESLIFYLLNILDNVHISSFKRGPLIDKHHLDLEVMCVILKKFGINGTQARQIFMLLHVHISKYFPFSLLCYVYNCLYCEYLVCSF